LTSTRESKRDFVKGKEVEDVGEPFAEAWYQAFGVTKKPPADTRTRTDRSGVGAEACKPAGLKTKKKQRIRVLG